MSTDETAEYVVRRFAEIAPLNGDGDCIYCESRHFDGKLIHGTTVVLYGPPAWQQHNRGPCPWEVARAWAAAHPPCPICGAAPGPDHMHTGMGAT